jgi:hypothetical protein
MRLPIALFAALLVTGCIFPTDHRYGQDACSGGTDQYGASCGSYYNGPTATVIAIGPWHQYTDAADSYCFEFSPTPASVRMGDSFYFQNNTGSSITILGSNQTPWVTVGPGATSAALNFSTAGVYDFGVQGCAGVGGTPLYGVLDVTIN